MDAWIYSWISTLTFPVLCLAVIGCIYILSKGADLLVEEAVTVSIRWGVPRFMIGATIVSLGTTFPEAAVSVWAASKVDRALPLATLWVPSFVIRAWS